MSENTDTELVHKIFIIDIMQTTANFCQDLKDAVMDPQAEDSMWSRSVAIGMPDSFAKCVSG